MARPVYASRGTGSARLMLSTLDVLYSEVGQLSRCLLQIVHACFIVNPPDLLLCSPVGMILVVSGSHVGQCLQKGLRAVCPVFLVDIFHDAESGSRGATPHEDRTLPELLMSSKGSTLETGQEAERDPEGTQRRLAKRPSGFMQRLDVDLR